MLTQLTDDLWILNGKPILCDDEGAWTTDGAEEKLVEYSLDAKSKLDKIRAEVNKTPVKKPKLNLFVFEKIRDQMMTAISLLTADYHRSPIGRDTLYALDKQIEIIRREKL